MSIDNGITGGIFPGKDGVVAIGRGKILLEEIFWFGAVGSGENKTLNRLLREGG